MTQRRKTLLLFGVSLAFSALLLEIASRFIMSSMFQDPRIYQEDERVSFGLIPERAAPHTSREFRVVYEINRHGFRGPDFELPKPRGTRHVLLLGDSFTFGVGVNNGDDVASVLRERYRAAGASPVEVINGGFAAGKSPDDAYAFLRSERGVAVDPDVLVHLIFVRNDLRDVHEHEWVETDEHGFPLTVRSPSDFPNKLGARGELPFYKANPILARLGTAQLAGRAYFALVELPRRNRQIQASWAEAGDTPDTGRLDSTLTAVAMAAADLEARLLFAIIPTRDQVVGRPDPYFDGLLAGITDHLDASALEYVVLTDEVTGLTLEDYWPEDRHWKPAGHAKVADVLFNWLEPELATRP